MMNDEKYRKHIDTMFGTKDVESFTEEEVDETLDNLLQCIPNDGKLYKYRKISDEKSFNYVYNSLLAGTLWLSRVDQFSDKTDCTVCYDPVNEVGRIENLLREKPELLLGGLMRALSKSVQKINPNFDESMLLRMVDCFDKESGKLDAEKALNIFTDYGCDIYDSVIVIGAIGEYVKKVISDKEDVIKEIANNFLNFNQHTQKTAFVCSLCESYKVKTMWENYADNNGISIEYDFKKLQLMSCAEKKFFCSLYKVNYVDDYEEVSFVPLIEAFLNCKDDNNTNAELNKKILISQITKTNDYAYEKEWRTFHFNLCDNGTGTEMKADLVSGIIFDENALKTENGKKILALAKQKEWEIIIRKLNITSTKYQYLPLNQYMG